MAGIYSLVSYAETVSSAELWYVGSYEILLLLMWQNLVWIVFHMEGCEVSSAEYRVHLVSV